MKNANIASASVEIPAVDPFIDPNIINDFFIDSVPTPTPNLQVINKTARDIMTYLLYPQFDFHEISVSDLYNYICLLYCHRNSLSLSVKKLLFNSTILSIFDYCDFVYQPCLSQQQSTRIQRVQNYCIRYCFNTRKFTHVTPLRDKLGWLFMNQRCIFHFSNFLFKLLRTENPSYLFKNLSYLNKVNPYNPHNTRSGRNILANSRHRTATFKNSFCYLAPFYFNLLPNDIENLDKSRLRNELFNYVKLNFR